MDTRTSSMDRETGSSKVVLQPNGLLLRLRTERRWGRPRLAKELDLYCRATGRPSPGADNLAKQIYRLETGRIRTPDEFYIRLICDFFSKSPQELFGQTDCPPEPDCNLQVRSHKFIPTYVGADAIRTLKAALSMHGGRDDGRYDVDYQVRGNRCRLYTWPFGVAMFHLVEDLSPGTIAEVSVWRRVSYKEDMQWAAAELGSILKRETLPGSPYVLSLYWVPSVPWPEPDRSTAMRILCIPRSLIERDDDGHTPSQERAELVEQELLRNGFDHPGIIDFGMRGISVAYASWSGVVYHPIAQDRSIQEAELVEYELNTQAAWSYCDYIRNEIEKGQDPAIPTEFGWRFLRGLLSKLTTERPQESDQHRSMRDAINSTSGIPSHLTQALDVTRDLRGAK